MKIDGSILRLFEKPRRKNLSIRHHDDHLRLERCEERSRLIILQTDGLIDRQVEFASLLLHRRLLEQLTATARFVRLSNDSSDGVTFFKETKESRNRENRGSH